MGFFSRWFGSKEKPAAAPKPVPNSAPAKAATSNPPAPLTREDLLDALGLKEPLPPSPAVDFALVGKVLEEFRATRPVPASPPALAMKILNVISSPDPDPAELAKLVSLEPALTAGVLRVARSALYRGVDEVENLRDAITRLGTREVASICAVLSSESVFGDQRHAEEARFGTALRELFVHASATALAAASLAFSLPKLKTKSDVVFLAALLHDIGMTVGVSVLAGMPITDPPLKLAREELQALLDAVHSEIGGEIHREWKLPEAAIQICVGHHEHAIAQADYTNELHVVRLTSALQLLQSFPPTESRLLEVSDSALFLGMNKFALRSFNNDVTRFTTTARTLGS